jgi:hypothetical protein
MTGGSAAWVDSLARSSHPASASGPSRPRLRDVAPWVQGLVMCLVRLFSV